VRRLIAAVALTVLLAGASFSPAVSKDSPSRDDRQRPNIVLIVTDDQRPETMRFMPALQRLLVERGTRYRKAMVPTSLCCPSRATILTGRYAHTTRMFGNGDVGGARWGGWRRFHDVGAETRTLGTALQSAGYRTAMVGKYLNYFGKHSEALYGLGYTPPGWDHFVTFLSKHGAYYDYRLNDGSHRSVFAGDYSTDVFAEGAVRFVEETPQSQPLFLMFNPYGPHKPYTPAPRHLGALDGVLPPYVPETLDQQPRTMPRWMRHREHAQQWQVDSIRKLQHEAMLSVDEALAGIVGALERTGRDRDTLFIFTSDNGYFWGEHRIIGKDAPYRRATEVPMVVRWDGHVPAGAVSDRMVLNVDLAETISRAAGFNMATDGIDMFGPTRRRGFVLEAMFGYHQRPSYCGWRTKHRMYVRWATGEQELFDYRLDPHEKRNLAGKPAWRPVLKKMRANAKEHCRPQPPRFDW
jgi:arylsulfatase A-like enzyme